MSDLGIRYYTRIHFRFRMSLQSHEFNIPIRKEENVCFLHRSIKFMQEDFLAIITNPRLKSFNLTALSIKKKANHKIKLSTFLQAKRD